MNQASSTEQNQAPSTEQNQAPSTEQNQAPSTEQNQAPSTESQASSTGQSPFEAQGWVGVDVSKDSLDAAVLAPGRNPESGHFTNDRAGFAKLARWAERLASGKALHFCMEATGSCSAAFAEHLAASGRHVSVVNPFLAKHCGLAQGARNKTDKADARLLADYCRRAQPPLWRMAAPEVRELTALVRHLDNLKQLDVQQRNRLAEASAHPLVAQSLEAVIDQTEAQIAAIEKAVASHIEKHPGLKADAALLDSIPGVGPVLAASILAELPDASQFSSAQAAAAYAGLSPQEHRSGTSVRGRTRLSKRGNAHLRSALYMPAMCALRFNPSVMALGERLRASGKHKMAIVGAAMRKLLMIAFGVLRSRTPYQKDYLANKLAKA